MTETWTADQCAAEWGGISPSTWRAYVSTGRAPKPLPGYDEQRRRRWDPDAVRSWKRPGRGARTDLTGHTEKPPMHDAERTAPMPAQHYLTFSDGSEVNEEKPEYGIAYETSDDPDGTWVWEESLGTSDPGDALAIVTARGWTASKVPGGWYGDDRDDSYRLDRTPNSEEAS